MRPQVLLVTLAVLAVLASLPLMSKGSGEEEGVAGAVVDDAMNASSWPCCDQCGICNFKYPPDCQCLDVTYHGCHPACRNCVKYTATNQVAIYRCVDMLTNFCERRCTPTAAAI